MDTPQMKMLQLLSTNVRQNITYQCKNSLVKENMLKVKLDSGFIQMFQEQRLPYKMRLLSNECKVSSL